MEQGYASVDDVDLFVAGLAERPVIGGLVGPTFACIIAQQFSNLRKGDRFWYENAGFESAFTPAQLQSLRQVSLSQVLCRTLGGSGTLQPHVFLPHETDGNGRRPCGVGRLAAIDLLPWQERDPEQIRRKDDVFRDPFVGQTALHNKQESFDLPPESSLRPNRGPDNFSSSSHSGPLPGSFIVELQPDSLTRPLRPNREPVQPSPIGSIVALRPQELPTLSRPPSSTPLPPHIQTRPQSSTTFSASGHRPFSHQEHPFTSTSSHETVDKVDFISNGATGLVHLTNDNQRPLTSTDRPIDNKLDFDDSKKRPTQIQQRPNKRPAFHLATMLRTAVNPLPPHDTTTDLNENDQTNTIATGHLLRKRETMQQDEQDAQSRTTNQTASASNVKQIAKFGFDVRTGQQTSQAIRYPNARPQSQSTRIKQPNVVIIQGTSVHDIDTVEPDSVDPDYYQYPDKYGLYRPTYTSTSTHRPPLSTNRYEYGPDGDYASSYDVTVVTTEKYSVYKPLGQRDRDRDTYLDDQYAQPLHQQHTNRPPYNFRPDKVHLGPSSSTARPPYISTPFSWDTRHGPAGAAAAQDRHDRGWSDAQPSKLDFDDAADDQSPFSSGSVTTTRPNRRPGTLYVVHDDIDEQDDRPHRQTTTPRQSDKLQSMITWRPAAVMHLPTTTTDRPTVTTTPRYPAFSPTAVLTNFVSSITRFFGGAGKTGRDNDMDMDNRTDAIELRLDERTVDNLTDTNRTDTHHSLVEVTHLTETEQMTPDPDDNDSANSTLQYDLDGYLRPEHMHIFRQHTPGTHSDIEHAKPAATDRPATIDGRINTIRPLNWHEMESRARNPNIISIVPFEVLTRPER